ncbi:MAG: right-handed parallel beta-helix repeat-containing protein [Asgard group archaeon]|nr:right-handed parallel beta-helix repeat-containing protein [Asgard group archaeon]
MKRLSAKIKTIIILSVISSCGIVSGLISWSVLREEKVKAEIRILEDSDFSEIYSFPGIGTISDPYRIENLEISTRKDYGIFINNTSKYFVIQNCAITARFSCIKIANIKNGTANIDHNILGMFIDKNTNYYHYSIGLIDLWNCSASKITNNIFPYVSIYGIIIHNSPFSIITRNNFLSKIFFDGISIYDSQFSSISFNSLSYIDHDTGIIVGNSDYTNIIGNSLNSTAGNTGAGIACSMSNNIEVSFNKIYRFTYGINIQICYSLIIKYNLINYTIFQAISCMNTANSSINNNLIYKSVNGISLSHNNTNNLIFYNEISNCTFFALSCNSNSENNNFVYQNNFLYNNLNGFNYLDEIIYEQAFDRGLEYWYNPELLVGNYWSDLIWSESAIYEIAGGTACDLYPSQYPFIISFGD